MPSLAGSQNNYQNVEAARLTQVQLQMERSAKLVSVVGEKVNSLTVRLSGVLMSEAPSQKGQSESKPVLVGHASAISNQNDQLELIDAALASILDRLEL